MRKRTAALAALLQPAFYRALAEPSRLRILAWLSEQPCARTVGDVAGSRCCAAGLSVVSRHLAVLRDAGIVECVRRGKQVFYRVRKASLACSLRSVADAVEGGVAEPPFPADEETKS